jgi:hypothetical protein
LERRYATNVETEDSSSSGGSKKFSLYLRMKKQKYWYKKEVYYCVLCGKETVYKWRVYEKPDEITRVIYKEDACGCHFF